MTQVEVRNRHIGLRCLADAAFSSNQTTMITRALFAASTFSLLIPGLATPTFEQQPWQLERPEAIKVPVTLGVMSRCPDALLCEALFDQIIPRVADKVDFSLTYVAKYALFTSVTCASLTSLRENSSDPEFGATCMHGRDECAGNVQQLCVAKYTPLKTWWQFVMCQNYETREKIGRSDVALKCARASQIDWETSEVGQCAGLDGSGTGEEGIQLLHESIQTTQALNIQYVASWVHPIRINLHPTQEELHSRHK